MSKKRNRSEDSETSADELETTEPTPTPAPTPAPEPARKEPCVSLAEMLAMKKIPDHHAHAMTLYAGDAGEKPFSEWKDLYQEMMTKPTDMPKEEWHEKFKN